MSAMTLKTPKKGSRNQKRILIRDADGWTHIATPGKAVFRSSLPIFENRFACAEAPAGLTFKRLNEQYAWHKKRWQESESWNTAKKALQNGMTTADPQIDKCVCIGLGSPSGLLRGGWVDRRTVSLFQLAALLSILEFLRLSNPSMPRRSCHFDDRG
jgi:hypothetical protein